jgi:hypothetical protein
MKSITELFGLAKNEELLEARIHNAEKAMKIQIANQQYASGGLLGGLGNAGAAGGLLGSSALSGIGQGGQAAFSNQFNVVSPANSALIEANNNITKLMADAFLDRYPEFENWKPEELITLWRTRFGEECDWTLHTLSMSTLSADAILFAHLSCYLLHANELSPELDTSRGVVAVVFRDVSTHGDR